MTIGASQSSTPVEGSAPHLGATSTAGKIDVLLLSLPQRAPR
jgi:hypothetical protein